MKRKRPLSEEEKALWQEVTRHDRRLHSEEKILPAAPALPKAILQSAQQFLKPPAMPAQSLPALARGDYANIDRNTADRFRKGDYEIDATLDLHGMTREKAFTALTQFIQAHAARQHRCLLVITGKGLRAREGEQGVLRESLPHWLNDDSIRPLILTFDSAKPKDGGIGAYYILLKRKR